MTFSLQSIKTITLPALVAGLLVGAPAFAQDNYPSKPITIIVPYAPGGTTDLIARAMADSLSRQLKQTVVIENKSGAAGSMGANEMVNTKPDGYRLALSPVGIFRQPYLQQTRYDPIKDLTYIAAFAQYPTLKELGYPVVIRSPLGLAGPKGLPDNIVSTLEKAVKVAMDDPAVIKVLKDYGIRTDYMDAAQYTEFAQKTFEEERSIVERMKQES